MQAWILHIIYGAFMGSASQYKEAKKMLRTGIDVRIVLVIQYCSFLPEMILRLILTPRRLPKTSVCSGRL